MPHRHQTLEINGQLIWGGQSLYHTRTNEVFWYMGVEDSQVKLEGLQDTLELSLAVFREKVSVGDFEIER
ncbi:hypothetical protein Natpe_4428 (plasmid) [Natrinema pellirubrum DSM 15624]|uniref:Uncharacterized protein n=1 Tax=Natrinema pellirubrum (strain DSM 15624 / CIP 106293 / JCM 10476 / NCIMB 786 / 157) TaxID=797303 RepID=L0JTH9_NATP1|nr:hypothetical protein Natpe_4428 [Natrinema pellirubrum DSM 15624]